MKIRHLTGRYAETPYRLGGQSRDEGLDCLSLILQVAEEKGVPLPDEWEGVTRKTYGALWERDRAGAMRKFIRFLGVLALEIPPGKAFAGDIVVAKNRLNGKLVVGIHAGGHVMLSAVEGEKITYRDLGQYDVKRAYRWAR